MPPTKRELLLAAAVFFALPLMAELALRVAAVPFDAQLYSPDRELGWVLRSGVSGRASAETPQWVRINSHGFHDAERNYAKPADTYRIAVLGNSWTEALQVPQGKIYTALLQAQLNATQCFAAKRVEVLNFGVAGYSTAQELLLLRQKVWNYHPDLVLLALYPPRDIANNVRELNNAVTPERSPYFVFHGDQLVQDDSFRSLPVLQPRQIWLQKAGFWLDDHFKTLAAVDTFERYGRIRVAMAAARERAEQSGVDNLEYAIYRPPQFPAMQDAWRVTEALLLAMRDEVQAHGAAFRIVTLATRPQVIPDAAQRNALLQKLGVSDFSYADKRIDAFAARNAMVVTHLAPALSVYAETHHAFLNGFNATNLGAGHWNETGHRLAAETIVADLCASSATQAPEDSTRKADE